MARLQEVCRGRRAKGERTGRDGQEREISGAGFWRAEQFGGFGEHAGRLDEDEERQEPLVESEWGEGVLRGRALAEGRSRERRSVAGVRALPVPGHILITERSPPFSSQSMQLNAITNFDYTHASIAVRIPPGILSYLCNDSLR